MFPGSGLFFSLLLCLVGNNICLGVSVFPRVSSLVPRWPPVGVVPVITTLRHGSYSPFFVSPNPCVSLSFVSSRFFFCLFAWHISSLFCSFQTSSPAICGPTSPMYRTPTYAVWLTSYLTLSLVPEQHAHLFQRL